MNRNKIIIYLLILIFICSGAKAATNNYQSEIDKLKKQIDSLKLRIDTVENRSYEDIKYSILDDIKFNGRLHIELLHNNNKGNTFGLLGGDIAKKRYDNAQITSLEFGGKKKLSDNSNFVFKIKSTDEYIRFKEVYFDYKVLPYLQVDIGQLTIPFSLESDNSLNGGAFRNETRGLYIGDLFDDTGVGVTAKSVFDNFGLFVGVYGNSYLDSIKDLNRTTANFRGYFNPYKDDNNLVHLGYNYTIQNKQYSKDDKRVPKIVDKNNINLKYDFKKTEKHGLEFALNHNQFNLQTEYLFMNVTPAARSTGQYEYNLSSFYAQTTFMFTGESINYNSGSFGKYKVLNPINNNGYGAFGLSLKFADSDLKDTKRNKLFDYGQYKEYDIAFRWLPVDFIDISLQYSRFEEKFENKIAIIANNNKANNKYNVISIKGKLFF